MWRLCSHLLARGGSNLGGELKHMSKIVWIQLRERGDRELPMIM
jgi:hypothetical protein